MRMRGREGGREEGPKNLEASIAVSHFPLCQVLAESRDDSHTHTVHLVYTHIIVPSPPICLLHAYLSHFFYISLTIRGAIASSSSSSSTSNDEDSHSKKYTRKNVD